MTTATSPTTTVNPTTLSEAQNIGSQIVNTRTPRQSVHSARQTPVAPVIRHTPCEGRNSNSQTVCYTPSGLPTKINRSRPQNLTDSSDSDTDSGASTSDHSD